MLVCFVFLAPLFLWDALNAYHRVAGPVFRFQQAIRTIADNQPVRLINLRKDDELFDVQEDFNDMLKSLAEKNAIELVGYEKTPWVQTTGKHQEPGYVGVHKEEPANLATPLGAEA
jgi:hypothetical protein